MIRVVRDLASNKNGEDMEKNAYIHFVDELDFKGLSVVGKRKSKKNRAVGFFFFLTAVSAKFERVRRSRKRPQQ